MSQNKKNTATDEEAPVAEADPAIKAPKSTAPKSITPKPAISKSSTKKNTPPQEQGERVFALDIGTRTVVGIIGEINDEVFKILDFVSLAHTKRAMVDGQIEDIGEVVKIVKKVKSKLETSLNMNLTNVSIAAAGRALKTQQVKVNINIAGRDSITEDMVKSFELEAILKAQSILDETVKPSEYSDSTVSFYCVGHSVVHYYLDDYPIKNFVGHKGKIASIEMIAAFLPALVVESLYSVMDKSGLEVSSLTLEPIAAMNVIVPPEVRLINIALVDIGAGTSDIAIAKNGSIIAYAMATTAGDEITEEIIRKYLVDFETAEEMKHNSTSETITYKDILGFEYTISRENFFNSLFPAVDILAETIIKNILSVNGEVAPSAIFLVGGGSKIPGLCDIISERLNIPSTRVAIGGHNFIKNVALGSSKLSGPEFVTPIGIGLTATMNGGYDFSAIILNGKKVRVFNTKNLTILDLLTIDGYKTATVIGRTGRNLTFNLNGEKRLIKGETAISAIITVGNKPANISTPIKQGDEVVVIPAVNGKHAQISIYELVGDVTLKNIYIDELSYQVGTVVTVNGAFVDNDYMIANFDDIKVSSIITLSDFLKTLPSQISELQFYKDTQKLSLGYKLCDNDILTAITVDDIVNIPIISASDSPAEHTLAEKIEQSFGNAPVYETEEMYNIAPVIDINDAEYLLEEDDSPDDFVAISRPTKQRDFKHSFDSITVSGNPIVVLLNDKYVTLQAKPDGSEHLFLDLLPFTDIDPKNPQGDIILTLNGQTANYMDVLYEKDSAIIAWEERKH